MTSRSRTIRQWEWGGWFAALGVATALLLPARRHLNAAHVTLAYLLIVQGGSARGGRPLGFALAATAFLCFDLFFLPPFGKLVVQNPLNWLVLVAFLTTSIVSAQLLYRAQAEAALARRHADEIDRLAALGAETLNVASAEEALAAIVSVLRETLGVDACAVHVADPASGRLRLASRVGNDGSGDEMEQGDVIEGGEWERSGALIRPLRVRGHTVGVLRIERASGLALTSAQLRVLDALAYYAALGVERVRLEAEAERATALQEAHKAKDAVLASVSHDLRTPLTAIKGLAHEIAEGGDERAEAIEEEADRLSAFVAKLLDLSRITSGAGAIDVQPNEAEDLLGAAAQQVAGQLRGHSLQIHVDSDGVDPLLFGRFDFSQTLRALVNLIENAAKYSASGAPIDLSARRDRGWLAFSVADRGPGIAESEQERIFEPFYRRAGAPPDIRGTGLGLSIARGIAEAQEGELTVETRDGGGSVFTLRVPAIRVEGTQIFM